jgi:hypothetical protein
MMFVLVLKLGYIIKMGNKFNIPITSTCISNNSYYYNSNYFDNEIYHEINELAGFEIRGRFINIYNRFGIYIKVRY